MMMFYLSLLNTDADRKLLIHIYENYRYRMLYIADQLLHDQAKAEDIVEEAFLRIIQNLGQFNLSECKKTMNLIVTIVKNLALDELRRQSRHPEVAYEENDAGKNLTIQALEQLRAEAGYADLAAYIQRLDEKYQLVFRLKYFNGLTYAQIEKLLELKPATAQSRFYRARKLLQQMILRERGEQDA